MAMWRAAQSVAEGLRSHPFDLALVVINVLVLIGFGYALHEISGAVERKDALLADLVGRCDVVEKRK
jgi:hypothetical protein